MPRIVTKAPGAPASFVANPSSTMSESSGTYLTEWNQHESNERHHQGNRRDTSAEAIWLGDDGVIHALIDP